MSREQKKTKASVDIGLTIKHHGDYGDKVDPGLAAILKRDKNAEHESVDGSVRPDESSHATTITEEFVDKTKITQANRPEIDPEDVENDNEGVNVGLTLQHHISYGEEVDPGLAVMLSHDHNTKNNSVDTSISGECNTTRRDTQLNRNVEDAVENRSRAIDGSVYELPQPSRSVSSLETSVENVAYERLEDNTTTSIPMQPSL